MPVFRPFKAVRPIPEKAKAIASPPYDVMDSDEARKMVKGNPLSYLYVEKAEIDLPEGTNLYSDEVYNKAKENFYKYLEDGNMIQDEKPAFYVYRQIMDGRVQIGLVGCASTEDYVNNIIKKHELTRADKEADRIRHVDTLNAHASPVFFTYRHREGIDAVVNKTVETTPEYDFVSDDGISHTLWVMSDPQDIEKITSAFADMDYLYVADGHHRTASAAKVGLLRKEANPKHTGEEEYNFFMTVIFPDNHLHIMDYNRVVVDLNNHTQEEFFQKVKEKFDLEPYDQEGPYHPEAKHNFGMYIDKKWYKLTAKEGTFDANSPTKSLDVSILQLNLLHPILGIGDPRTDQRIDFIGGIRGLKELEERVDSGREVVAFSMYPTSIQELMNIADAGETMPPKSTWFEPKLRSGLFIHLLD